MKLMYWNIRGLGSAGRRKQLKELMSQHKVDVICLQETIKENYTIGELKALEEGGSFSWNWTAARGHSGGTLIGVKQGDVDALEMDEGEFFSSIRVENRQDKFQWEIINVFGPVQVDRNIVFCSAFLSKLLP